MDNLNNENYNYQKLNIFQKYLKLIKTDFIRDFTGIAILNFPEYFWTLPASTSGKHHGNETLIEHVLGCAYIAKNVQEQFKNYDQIWKDQLMSAILLHDGWRCGFLGHEKRFTQKMIEKKGYSKKLLGQLCTSKDHPYVAASQLMKILKKSYLIDYKMFFEDIIEAVKYHMGPWTPKKEKYYEIEMIINFSHGSFDSDDLILLVHTIDAHQTWNSQYNKKKKSYIKTMV